MTFINIVIFIILILIIYTLVSNKHLDDNLILEHASFDNEFYLVQNKNDKSQCANKLAYLKHIIIQLRDYLSAHINEYPDHVSDIKKFISRTQIINLKERPEFETEYTSYTVNKGDVIVMCLRSSVLDKIHDNNTLSYVAIHECAHILSTGIGHGDEFVKNFKFLLGISKKIGIYKPTDYTKKPQEYCGMTIDEYLL